MRGLAAATAALVVGLSGGVAAAAQRSDAETLRSAKALFFDRKYAESRELWSSLVESRPRDASALYWVAKCSESLGERERALREYADFLARDPEDPLLIEEAKTSRVGLAARLYQSGREQHLPVLERGLRDPSRTVRYYAALQLGGLGAEVGRAAIPVLKEILAEETDPDLVDRARLRLLRLDPGALSGAARRAAEPRRSGDVRWVRLQIQEAGQSEPSVSLSLPVALAELVFKSLPDDAKRELEREGIDAENFWERLRRLGPTSILEIEGDDARIRLWLE